MIGAALDCLLIAVLLYIREPDDPLWWTFMRRVVIGLTILFWIPVPSR